MRTDPFKYVDPFGLVIMVAPCGSPGWAENVQQALDLLAQTDQGAQLIDATSNIDVVISPGGANSTGSDGITISDTYNFVPVDEDGTYPDEAVNSGDVVTDLAVVIGHELGHYPGVASAEGYDDPENVVVNENPIREQLGLPERSTYHGKPLSDDN